MFTKYCLGIFHTFLSLSKKFLIIIRYLKKAFDSNGFTYPAALLVMIGEGTFFWLNTHLDDVTSLKDDHPEGSCINDVYQF